MFSSPAIPMSISGTSASESLDIQSLCTLNNIQLARSPSKRQLDGESDFLLCSASLSVLSTLFRMLSHLQTFLKSWVLVVVKKCYWIII